MPTKPKPAQVPLPPANGVSEREVLTLAEAAALLRVPEDGLRREADAGRIPGRLIAGEWRFVKPTLIAWLSEPASKPEQARSGAELVERIQEIHEQFGFQETEEEAEAFIAKIYAARKADPVGG